MTFSQSCDFKIPFGKYRGTSLDEIARTDDGLLYLEWLREQRMWQKEPVDIALRAYLSDAFILKELAAIQRGRKGD